MKSLPEVQLPSLPAGSWPTIFGALECALVAILNVWGGLVSVSSNGALLFCIKNVNTHCGRIRRNLLP